MTHNDMPLQLLSDRRFVQRRLQYNESALYSMVLITSSVFYEISINHPFVIFLKIASSLVATEDYLSKQTLMINDCFVYVMINNKRTVIDNGREEENRYTHQQWNDEAVFISFNTRRVALALFASIGRITDRKSR